MGLADTHDLLREALAGGEGALDRLLERLRPRLVIWVSGRLSSGLRRQVEPEDVAQDALLAVSTGFAAFHGDEPQAFFRWFFTVAENRIRDLADHHGALKRRLPEPRSFSQTSPSTAASRSEQVARVMRALEALPEEYREVIVLVKVEERPVSEVAALLNLTENAVRVRCCRAFKRLQEELAAGGSESR
jgi:RNA polymerase sigma-70 factor (ECF subfamily)